MPQSRQSLQFRWVGDEDVGRIAQARLRCYGSASRDLDAYAERLRADQRARAGDYLLAERGGEVVGTTTSLSMRMWVRGAAVPCQGIAWVGTVRTARRAGASAGAEPGIATQLMREALRKGRDRGEVVSALMPFRASFYEHSGYGVIERRNDWTVPISLLPQAPAEGLRLLEPVDVPELVRLKQRITEAGQCDLERTEATWEHAVKSWEDGWGVIDRPDSAGAARGWLYFRQEHVAGKDIARVIECGYEDAASLRRLLSFLGTLRDQYASAVLTLPADVPLNWLLRERQLPHRPVNHATAELRVHTRMQARVLDHKRLIESMRLPASTRGRAAVAIHEPEGEVSRFTIDLADGRAAVSTANATGAIELDGPTWAAIALGHLPATHAARAGLIATSDPAALATLDAFAAGPMPYTYEYF